MVEGACLENRCAGDRTGGSNPFPSAKGANQVVMRFAPFLHPKIRAEVCIKVSCALSLPL